MDHYLSDLTWEEAGELARRKGKVLIPVGSLEQHGPHLPLSTDTIIAFEVAKRVSEQCSVALAPPIFIGYSPEHTDFPGTMTLELETFVRLVRDMCKSLKEQGFVKIVFINGHGGNRPLLEAAIQSIKRELGAVLYIFNVLDVLQEKFKEIRESSEEEVGHADEVETSLLLAICPEKVRLEKAVREALNLPLHATFEARGAGKVSFAWKASELTKSGVIGNPLPATADKGKVLLDYAVRMASSLVDSV